MADDNNNVDFSPQWTAPQPQNDALMAAMQPPQNELDTLSSQPSSEPYYRPQQNELDAQAARNLLAGQTPTPTANDAPVDVQSHMAGIWRHLSNAVGEIAGPTTYKATVNPDGSMNISQEPATNKEKWMRIAALALGGAAKGLAAGQGPGGASRAVGAGMDFGQQERQQQKQQTQQDVEFGNKQMLAQANLVHAKQQAFLVTQQLKNAGLQYSEEVSNQLKNYADLLTQSPGNQDWGTYPATNQGLMDLKNKNPDLAKQISGNGSKELIPVPYGDGTIHAITVDRNWFTSRNREPLPIFKYSGKMTSEGTPEVITEMAPVGSTTPQEAATANTTFINGYGNFLTRKASAEKKEEDKQPTLASLAQTAASDPDPEKRKQAQRAVDLMKEKAGTGTGGGGAGTAPLTGLPVGQDLTDEERKTAFAKLSPADAATVRAIGEVRQAPPTRTTKEGQRIMGLVNQIYPGYDMTNYANYAKTKLDYAPGGKSGLGLNFIGTALKHMDRMQSNIDALHNVDIPLIGSAINAVKQGATKGTNPALKAFVDDQKAVTNEIARAYQGGAISDHERAEMEQLISSTDSPETIRAGLEEFRHLLQGKLEQYQIGWDAQMPRGQHQPVLDALQQRGTAHREPPKEQPQQNNAPQFDARAWAAANQGKDVNAAIAQAKKQGMTIINAPQ